MGVKGEGQFGRVGGGFEEGVRHGVHHRSARVHAGEHLRVDRISTQLHREDTLRSILCLHNGNHYHISLVVVFLVCCLSFLVRMIVLSSIYT